MSTTPFSRRCRVGITVDNGRAIIRLRHRESFDSLPGTPSEHRHAHGGHSLAKEIRDAEAGTSVLFVFWIKEPDDDAAIAARAVGTEAVTHA